MKEESSTLIENTAYFCFFFFQKIVHWVQASELEDIILGCAHFSSFRLC